MFTFKSWSLELEFEEVLKFGRSWFPPKGQEWKELVLNVTLGDRDHLKLWQSSWNAKTRAETANVAKLVREMRNELGFTGISIPLGLNACIPKHVSLTTGKDSVLRLSGYSTRFYASRPQGNQNQHWTSVM